MNKFKNTILKLFLWLEVIFVALTGLSAIGKVQSHIHRNIHIAQNENYLNLEWQKVRALGLDTVLKEEFTPLENGEIKDQDGDLLKGGCIKGFGKIVYGTNKDLDTVLGYYRQSFEDSGWKVRKANKLNWLVIADSSDDKVEVEASTFLAYGTEPLEWVIKYKTIYQVELHFYSPTASECRPG